ncbi:MAG: peroxiredoxin [Bacillota bacterium]|jgi:peroxiredoxin Q/BCP
MTSRYRLSALVLALLAGAALPASAQKGPPTAVIVSGPEVGTDAPDFRLPWASKDSLGAVEDDFVLRKQGGKVVVLAFYPKDFTSGCTAEMHTFTDRYADLFPGDVVVVGISADSLESHRQFAASVGAPFRLLSDPSQRVSAMYGSKGDQGYNRRTIYVIDAQGRVAYRDMRFGALDPKSYDRLKAAVRAARSS